MFENRAVRIAELMKSALERDPGEWPSFLDEACGADAELRVEVESLLQFEQSGSGFMRQPAVELAAHLLVNRRELKPEETVGEYQIISLIGKGGMGDVYLALDLQLRRKVALKIIRDGVDIGDIHRRFIREEQILASLNHPNIARLYGAAVSQNGVPYLVMEYVEGECLDDYCNRRSLTTNQRLNIFRKICAAVTYAHQHLVIHRDLKPANIRVTTDGEPMLLDFGIARLLDAETSRTSGHTVNVEKLMTPDYASPEQLRGGIMTTASDVYSLGVVLYELLTGRRPYRSNSRNPDEIAKAVLNEEAEGPGTAVRGIASLGGDLDNIVLMAMRKEPERRYASAGQFSADIGRYLEGLPVIARKDTWSYRSAKFVRRHRVGMSAAAIVILTFLGGIVSTTWEAQRTKAQKIRAEKRFNDVRHLANSFLFEIDPQIQNLQGATAARQTLVKRGLEYLDSLALESGNDRSLQHELAKAYWRVGSIQGKPSLPNLGDTAGAIASYRKAQAIFESLLMDKPTDRAVQRDLAFTYQYLGHVLGEKTRDLIGNLENQRKAIAIFEALSSADPGNLDDRLNLVKGYNYLATATADHAQANQSLSECDDALQNHRRAIAIAEKLSINEPARREFQREVAASHQRLGYTLRMVGDMTGEISNYRAALENDRNAQKIYETLVAAEPTNISYVRDAADAGLSIGRSQLRLGDSAGALETERQAAAIFKTLAEADPRNMQARVDQAEAAKDIQQALAKASTKN